MSHTPITIDQFATGLVQYQPNQILKNDAFPILTNALCFRNTIRRRYHWNFKGRLKRSIEDEGLGDTSGSGAANDLLIPIFDLETTATIVPGTLSITVDGTPDQVFTDAVPGILSNGVGGLGTVNYVTAQIIFQTDPVIANSPITISFDYYPGLPVMGIFDRNTSSNAVNNVFFDTTYAYNFSLGSFNEFLPGTSWAMEDFTFPSPTNYWQDKDNFPIFWVSTTDGATGDPIRYANGQASSSWFDFYPTVTSTDTSPPVVMTDERMFQCKFLIPFRGRLFAFNTFEGPTLATVVQKRNRIRCSAIGVPFTYTSTIITTVNPDAWNDTIPGQGYSEDLPTTEEILEVELVLNQIVIKTTTRTWILSNSGVNITPFRVDLLDENLGTNSSFAAVNMGGSLIEIGNRSITSTTPTKVESIDEKILDFVFNINKENHGLERVYSLRDYKNRFNSYIYPYQPEDVLTVKFPNRRLIYNYDNSSWAIYEDSLTCLGYFREQLGLTWAASNFSWESANIPWTSNSTNEVLPCAGNQQGYVGLIDSTISESPSLYINSITPSGLDAAIFGSPAHNLTNGMILKISDCIAPYDVLNGIVGQVTVLGNDTLSLYSYNPVTDNFDISVTAPVGTYLGLGQFTVRHNFNIFTKAFNLLAQGQSLHISYVDTLTNVSNGVTVQMNVYISLNTSNPVNDGPENPLEMTTFSKIISLSNPTSYFLTQNNNRTLVNQRGNMIMFEFTLPNSVMASDNYSVPFQISSLTVWVKPAGRPLMPLGGG